MDISEYFADFNIFEGLVPQGILDFSGCVDRFTRDGSLPDLEHRGNLTFRKADPIAIDEEIFEWIDIVDSVKAAVGTYCFVELGAGYGRWSARAYKLARQYGFKDSEINLVTVEADPLHSKWLMNHFELNQVKANHFHFECALSDFEGEKGFYIGRPGDRDREYSASQWFGQSLANFGWEGASKLNVAVNRLSKIIAETSIRKIDLIASDLQGEDSRVFLDSKEVLQFTAKVHIGTDSTEEERLLRSFFAEQGWCLKWDYSNTGIRKTTFGEIRFVDGVQTWTNPYFQIHDT